MNELFLDILEYSGIFHREIEKIGVMKYGRYLCLKAD